MSAPPPVAPVTPPAAKPRHFLRWHRRILGFCLVVFAFEVGLFLLVFPWLDNWDLNWIPVHSHRFSDLWMSRYFRGAISGLGLLNIYIALMEFAKQVKSLFVTERK
ncbi:MAG: hypothetical protein WB992_03835 [Bryobacteraceae bacterium]